VLARVSRAKELQSTRLPEQLPPLSMTAASPVPS
jgi:hypothetical protein